MKIATLKRVCFQGQRRRYNRGGTEKLGVLDRIRGPASHSSKHRNGQGLISSVDLRFISGNSFKYRSCGVAQNNANGAWLKEDVAEMKKIKLIHNGISFVAICRLCKDFIALRPGFGIGSDRGPGFTDSVKMRGVGVRGVSALLRRKKHTSQECTSETGNPIQSKPFSNEGCIFEKPDAVWLQSNLSVYGAGLTICGKVIYSQRFVPKVVTVASNCVSFSNPVSGRVLGNFHFSDIFCIISGGMPEEKQMEYSRDREQFQTEYMISQKLELEANQFAIVTTKCSFHRGRTIIFRADR
jgi:hypothetical protein